MINKPLKYAKNTFCAVCIEQELAEKLPDDCLNCLYNPLIKLKGERMSNETDSIIEKIRKGIEEKGEIELSFHDLLTLQRMNLNLQLFCQKEGWVADPGVKNPRRIFKLPDDMQYEKNTKNGHLPEIVPKERTIKKEGNILQTFGQNEGEKPSLPTVEYLIYYDDSERDMEYFTEEDIALNRLGMVSGNWNCHLFKRIKSV